MPSNESGPTARQFAAALILASALQATESLLPRLPLFPWLRLGLSWAVLMPWLLSFGCRQALALFLCRNALVLSCGAMAGSSFLISAVSGCASLLLVAPWVRRLVDAGRLGWTGAGALLACGFNFAQLGTASGLVGGSGLFGQTGALLLWSCASGAAVGRIAHGAWRGRTWEDLALRLPASSRRTLPAGAPLLAALSVVLLIASLVVSDPAAAGLLLLLALPLDPSPRRTLAGAWPFFAWLAWIHLPAPGHYLSWAPVSAEGVRNLARHAASLGAFLLAAQGLARSLPWDRLDRIDSTWARGLALALPCVGFLFPSALEAARSRGGTWDERFWAALSARTSSHFDHQPPPRRSAS